MTDKGINPNTNRSEQRLLRKKKQSKAIYSRFIILSISVAILIGAGLGLLYTIEQKQLQKKIANETLEILKKSQERQAQSGFETKEKINEQKNLTKISYIPKEVEQLPIENFEEKVSTLMEQAIKKYKDTHPMILIGRVGSENYTEQLASYRVEIETYQWQVATSTFKKIGMVQGDPAYINQKTGQAVTSQELISEPANLLGIQQVIQQQILDEAKKPQEIIDAVLNLPRMNWETEMTYLPNALHITLPKNDTGINEITLPYKEIQSFIQTDLVNPAFLSEQPTPLDPNKKYIVLTFDDGPLDPMTPSVLKTLREKEVKATFFLLGQNAKERPDLVKQIQDEGHELASHSYSHPQLTLLSKEAVEKEVKETDRAIFEATGILPRTFRPPYGAINPTVANIIGKPIIQWNIDSLDWQAKQKEATINQVTQTASAGGIVLMHDIQPATVAALPVIIDNLSNQGFQFITIEELLQLNVRPLYQYFSLHDSRKV